MTPKALTISMLMLMIMFLPLVGNVEAVAAPDIVVTSVYWGSNSMAGISVHPGDTNIPLSIVLSNAGDATAREVNSRLTLSAPFSYIYRVNGNPVTSKTIDQSAGDIQSGSSFTLRLALAIADDAVAGVHRLTLVISYKTATGLLPVEKTLNVDVPIWTGDVRVQHVLTVPAKVYPGDNQVVVKAWLVNSGTGSTADLQARLLLDDPFRQSSGGSDTFFLGTMQPGQVSETDFYVDVSKSAKFGSYNLKLVTTSAGSSGQVEIGQIPIYVTEKVIFEIIQVEPTVLHSGDSGISIRVVVKNTGTIAAESVRAQLLVGNYFSGTLTDFLGTIQPGESKTAYLTVDVDANAASQLYGMDLRVDWTQSNNSLEDTLPVELLVSPAELPVTLIAAAAILLALVATGGLLRRRSKGQHSKS